MDRFSHKAFLPPVLLALLALAGCGKAPPSAPAPTAAVAAPREMLARIVEQYWDERLPLENAIAPQYLADSLDVERRYLAATEAVHPDALDAQARLTYEIFRRQRQLLIEGFAFPAELMPLNPFGGKPLQFAALAADKSRHPLLTAADCEAWLARIDAYVRWTQQATANMRDGIDRGYTSPRALVERMLPILAALGADTPANVYYVPLRSLSERIAEPERTRLAKQLSDATSAKLLPANRGLHDFLAHDYLPHARPGIAWSELPLGPQWYAYLVKRATGTALSPEEIHRLGVAEVERIGAHAPPPPATKSTDASAGLASAPASSAIPATTSARPAAPATAAAATPGLTATTSAVPAASETLASAPSTPGTLPANASAAEALLKSYADLGAQVRSRMPALFNQPAPPDDMRGADSLPQPGMPLYYQAAGDLTPEGVLYVSTGSGSSLSVAAYLEQAAPGREFQLAVQRGLSGLPRFRRFGAEPAFTDGWGLYAVSLGEPLGLYPDEAARTEAAAAQMRCAVALVVDTGLHAQGWTRVRALDYLHAHLSIEDPEAQSLIDWYAANPADALACTMGGMKFRALWARAQQELGARFDPRGFHTEILGSGAMPMDILEARMKLWIDGQK
jgi:uncharacterized protein (DUF885 family)